jgi:hypothetical protein
VQEYDDIKSQTALKERQINSLSLEVTNNIDFRLNYEREKKMREDLQHKLN